MQLFLRQGDAAQYAWKQTKNDKFESIGLPRIGYY